MPDCFGCGAQNMLGLRLDIVSEDGHARATGRFRVGQHGGPGLVHGGLLTTMCDEAMGAVGGVGGRIRLTRTLTMSFRKPVEIERDVEAVARVVEQEGCRYRATAEVRYVGREEILASAEGQFVVID